MSQLITYRRALYIAIVFFIIYLASFNGIPISDDEQLFAVTARNIARLGHFNAEPLYGNIRLEGQYSVEPLHPFLASVWYYFLKLFTNNNHLQLIYILPVIYLSISASLLFLLITQFGYDFRFAIELVFWCGLSTVLWPYAATFFRETIITMLLLASWLFFERIFAYQQIKNNYLILFLLTVLLIALTKVIYITVIVPYALMALQRQKEIVGIKLINILLSTFIIVAILGLFSYFASTNTNIFHRYSLLGLQEYLGVISSISKEIFWQTIFLSLFSFWKGFFIYSPLCIFGLFITFTYIRARFFQQLYLLQLPTFIFLCILLFQIITYGANIWTPPWSVRFLVPVIPLVVIASLPLLENLYDSFLGRTLIRGVGITGVLIQLNAILVNSSLYTSYIMQDNQNFPSSEYWNIFSMPAFHQWTLLREGYPANMLILRVIEEGNFSLAAYTFLVSAFVLTSYILFSILKNDPFSIRTFQYKIALFIPVVLSLFFFIFIRDPFYQNLTPTVERACQKINNQFQDGDMVVLQPYPSALWLTFVNRDCLQGNWYSLSSDTSLQESDINLISANKLINGLIIPYNRIWLVQESSFGKSVLRERLNTSNLLISTTKLENLGETELLLYQRK